MDERMDTQMQDVSETLNGAVEGATDFLASVVGKKTRRRKKVEAGAAGGKARAKKIKAKAGKKTAKKAVRKAAGQTKGERREVRAMGAVVRPKTRLEKFRFTAEGVTLFFKDNRKLTTPLKFLDKRLAKMQPKELKQAVITQRGKCLFWKTAGIEVPIENALHCKLI